MVPLDSLEISAVPNPDLRLTHQREKGRDEICTDTNSPDIVVLLTPNLHVFLLTSCGFATQTLSY